MKIISLSHDHPTALRQAAEILILAFREHWPGAWRTLDEAVEEVHEMLAPDRICRAACDTEGDVLGWIGGIPEYDGNVWELHPLAVHPAHQRRGIGRALVADFEAQVRARGRCAGSRCGGGSSFGFTIPFRRCSLARRARFA